MKREPFPLQWPDGWRRTPDNARRSSKFGHKCQGQVSLPFAWNFLGLEVGRLGGVNGIITTDLPTNSRGIPYASGRVADVGVAVWFVLPDAVGTPHERVYACDKWTSVAENMYAIGKSIEAMRGLERWGAADAVNRAFSGFTALSSGSGEEYVGAPPPPPPPPRRTWREVLGETFAAWPELDRDELYDLAKSRHRKLMKLRHPDVGGTHEQAMELNVALAEAETELA